jgi:peroxiredoxin
MKSRVSKAAVPFELKDTAGNTHRLEDDLGHWQLLVFHRHLG